MWRCLFFFFFSLTHSGSLAPASTLMSRRLSASFPSCRAFYTDLLDLKEVVPAVLLGLKEARDGGGNAGDAKPSEDSNKASTSLSWSSEKRFATFCHCSHLRFSFFLSLLLLQPLEHVFRLAYMTMSGQIVNAYISICVWACVYSSLLASIRITVGRYETRRGCGLVRHTRIS